MRHRPAVPKSNQLVSAKALTTASLPQDWRAVLDAPTAQRALATITTRVQAAIESGAIIYPEDPWRALRLTPLSAVKVLILGQDPYHGPGQAQGLAFSGANTGKTPPSLRNILTEIDRDLGQTISSIGAMRTNDLSGWARQGVLLLNTVLTVQSGQAASHAKLGWQAVTDVLIDAVAQRNTPTVYMLWGAHAQAKLDRIEATSLSDNRLILQANHPSPLSARRPPVPFIGCGHFSATNRWFAERGLSTIDW